MSTAIKSSYDDETLADIKTCAISRLGDLPTSLSEYQRLATIQLMGRDLASASKKGKTTTGTDNE
ncbi:MAG: hypothetical protein ABFC92_02745 [Rectinema sp.]